MYKLSDLSHQKLHQLIAQQKEKLLGTENYRRFGTRFPLYVKFFRDTVPPSLKPGGGSLCYIHRPVLGSGFLMAEIHHVEEAGNITPYLTTAVYDLNDPMTIDYSELDSFVLFIGLQGFCELTDDSGSTVTLSEGETVLLPAVTRNVKVDGTIKFLETYV